MVDHADKFLTDEEEMANSATQNQLAHFADKDKCQGIQLPKGVMLRYNLSTALYFYLETGILDGAIRTKVYASDSPYDKGNRVLVSDVGTPMFSESDQDPGEEHSGKVEAVVNDWVRFVDDDVEFDEASPFTSFEMEKEE